MEVAIGILATLLVIVLGILLDHMRGDSAVRERVARIEARLDIK